MAQYSSNATSSPAVSSTTTPGGQQSQHQKLQLPQPLPESDAAAAAAAAANQSQHKRVYQACIPCRRRKVRCDLGSVDNPHDPPCVRCRRESKECFFSATRRKRKADDEGSDVDEYIVRNGRKKLHAGESPSARFDRRTYSDVPLTPGGSQGRKEPLRRPDGTHREGDFHERDGDFENDGDANQTVENIEAQTVMRREMYGPHDALDLLYKAATDRLVVVMLFTLAACSLCSPCIPALRQTPTGAKKAQHPSRICLLRKFSRPRNATEEALPGRPPCLQPDRNSLSTPSWLCPVLAPNLAMKVLCKPGPGFDLSEPAGLQLKKPLIILNSES